MGRGWEKGDALEDSSVGAFTLTLPSPIQERTGAEEMAGFFTFRFHY
jgi:hypothetical protein